MFWVLIGMLVGGSWVLLAQSAPWLAYPIDSLTLSLSHDGSGAAETVARAFGASPDMPLVHVAGALGAALAPGIVCLLVAETAGAAHAVRNTAAGLFTCAAFASFFWLPGHEAAALLLGALLLDVLLAFGEGLLLTLPVTAIVTAITGRLLVDVVHGAGRFDANAQTLGHVTGSPDLCRLALAAAALCLSIGALRLLIRAH